MHGNTQKKYKLLICVNTAICLLSGCASLPKPNFSPNQVHIRIVTYNINWGAPRPQVVVDYLAQIDADIVFLQETHSHWEMFLMNQLKIQYPYTVFRDNRGAGGNAFLSKYPIKNAQVIKSDEGWFPALYGEVKTPIGTMQLLNVHLRPPLSENGRATISSVYQTPRIHSKEMEDYFQKVDPARPIIIAGDFNENESGNACQWLIDKQFTDCLSVYDHKSKTWHWRLPMGLSLKERYDHIFISEQMRCSGARVDNTNASDHEPVVASIF